MESSFGVEHKVSVFDVEDHRREKHGLISNSYYASYDAISNGVKRFYEEGCSRTCVAHWSICVFNLGVFNMQCSALSLKSFVNGSTKLSWDLIQQKLSFNFIYYSWSSDISIRSHFSVIGQNAVK